MFAALSRLPLPWWPSHSQHFLPHRLQDDLEWVDGHVGLGPPQDARAQGQRVGEVAISAGHI